MSNPSAQTLPKRLRWAATDAWTITRRDLNHWVGQPFGIIVTLLFPLMLVLMFGYIFGGAMSVPGGNASGGSDCREFLMPGMFATTMAFGLETTMTSVATDAARASPTASAPCPWPRRRWS
jgi:ABC-2 type transport system permease protein